MKNKKRVFIVWKNFQRRVEVLAPVLDLEVFYFHYDWEEDSKILKFLSYFPKFVATLKCLFQNKPYLIFVQFPPTPALYCVALYSMLSGSKYVMDCHNSMINSHWSKWIFAKRLLSRGLVIVHNDHIAEQVRNEMGLSPVVLRDGIMNIRSTTKENAHFLKNLGLSPKNYVLLPWTFSPDEPVQEAIDAARMLPEINFVMTWYKEKMSPDLLKSLPRNLVLTGFLPEDDFNFLFSSAGVALVLTRWESTQLSGMQEAMAFEVPAVVSDLQTTRFLYKDAPVYVNNDPESIAEGVQNAFRNKNELAMKMGRLKMGTKEEFEKQIATLEKLISSNK